MPCPNIHDVNLCIGGHGMPCPYKLMLPSAICTLPSVICTLYSVICPPSTSEARGYDADILKKMESLP